MEPVQMCEAGPEVRRYRKAIWVSMGGYMVMLMLAITFIKEFPGSSWRYPVMLVPVIPAIFGLVGIMRAVRAMDEMQRRVHLEGVAFAFVVTVLVTLTWGLLERAGMPKLPSVWVCTLMLALWGIGNRIAARRYR
jgi:hypothetical protein